MANELRLQRRIRCTCLAALLSSLLSSPAGADYSAGMETESLMGLSLEELLQVQVTTYSRKPQQLSATPAAVFVISQDDIRRSGARTLPNVLRMVPGVQVAQIDSSTWAVTARGSNGKFANKLLVLMDGRTLYDTLFSGVYWDVQDTDLSAIERIEVIRGPGAAMWGSNAVNGVINIITKKAADTQGFVAEAAAGTHTTAGGQLRYGGTMGSAQYRVYGKYFDRAGYIANDVDEWNYLRGGARVDWSNGNRDELTVLSEVYSGTLSEDSMINSPVAPFSQSITADRDTSGAFASIGWTRKLSEDSDFQLKLFYDRTERSGIQPEQITDTLDLDFQHHFGAADRHDIVWGLGVRQGRDDTTPTFTVALGPEDRTQRIFSGFLHDEIRLLDERVYLTLGTKVEKNNFSPDHLEWSPNARLSWLMTESSTSWASVAKAVRTPSRIELDGRITGVVLPPFVPLFPGVPAAPLPTALTINGNPELSSETVMAYEIGYRNQPTDGIAIDVALFYNEYSDLRIQQFGAPFCEPSGTPVTDPLNPVCFAAAEPYINTPTMFVNDFDQDSYGVEIAASYRISDSWRMHAAYSFLKLDGEETAAFSAGPDAPEHQFSLRSNMSPMQSIEFDLWLRYVDKLEQQNIDSYATLDARLMWSPREQFSINLVGRNLLERDHMEFTEEFGGNLRVEIEREAYVDLRWQF